MDDKDPFEPLTPPPASEGGGKTPNYQSGTPMVDDYQDVAEKVGMVPDFDTKRNLLQLAITAPFAIIGFVAGLVIRDVQFGLILAVAGLLVGVFISGFVLMILGLMRKKRAGKQAD